MHTILSSGCENRTSFSSSRKFLPEVKRGLFESLPYPRRGLFGYWKMLCTSHGASRAPSAIRNLSGKSTFRTEDRFVVPEGREVADGSLTCMMDCDERAGP